MPGNLDAIRIHIIERVGSEDAIHIRRADFGLLKPCHAMHCRPLLARAAYPIDRFVKRCDRFSGRAADQRKGAEHWFKRRAWRVRVIVEKLSAPLFERNHIALRFCQRHACARLFLCRDNVERIPRCRIVQRRVVNHGIGVHHEEVRIEIDNTRNSRAPTLDCNRPGRRSCRSAGNGIGEMR